MNRAILIIIDGCRVDALQKVTTTNIGALRADGSSSFEAITVVPPLTLPSLFSLFTSSDPITHGITTNTGQPFPSPSIAGLAELLAYHGRSSAAFFTWEQLRNLWPPGSVSHSVCSNVVQSHDSDFIIAGMAVDYLIKANPDFCFVYLERTDFVGHAQGWMSPAYLEAVERADAAIGDILAGLEKSGLRDSYHLIIQSDHGGNDYHHKEPDDAVMHIPWIAAGPTVRADYVIQETVSIVDTAPTLAHILGIDPHPTWEGKIVDEIFRISSN